SPVAKSKRVTVPAQAPPELVAPPLPAVPPVALDPPIALAPPLPVDPPWALAPPLPMEPPLALAPPVLPLDPELLLQAARMPVAPSPINASCLNRLVEISTCLSFPSGSVAR